MNSVTRFSAPASTTMPAIDAEQQRVVLARARRRARRPSASDSSTRGDRRRRRTAIDDARAPACRPPARPRRSACVSPGSQCQIDRPIAATSATSGERRAPARAARAAARTGPTISTTSDAAERREQRRERLVVDVRGLDRRRHHGVGSIGAASGCLAAAAGVDRRDRARHSAVAPRRPRRPRSALEHELRVDAERDDHRDERQRAAPSSRRPMSRDSTSARRRLCIERWKNRIM